MFWSWIFVFDGSPVAWDHPGRRSSFPMKTLLGGLLWLGVA